MKSGRENSSEARYMITREKRALNLGCDGGVKPAQIDASKELLALMFQHHYVCGGWLTKVDFVK